MRARRDRRHRRRVRQRPAGADGGAVGRATARAGRRRSARSAAPIGALGPRQRRALGLRYVPEERLGRGAVPELSLAENALLTATALQRRGFVRPSGVQPPARRR
ncbi:MAG: hypothetical protein MZW92_56565 [Comamonadaceae bacterium]|nr:hypothetical protein [Comamonadaceae bacterium]